MPPRRHARNARGAFFLAAWVHAAPLLPDAPTAPRLRPQASSCSTTNTIGIAA